MRLMALSLGVLMAGSCARMAAQNEGGSVLPVTPCTLEKGIYTCSWPAFKRTLAAAKTVSVQTEPMDVRADAELAKLAKRLGKTVVEAQQGPEITFLLVPLNNKGAFMGPAEQDIATLRVYAGRTKTVPGKLIWAESYRGTEDIPWPAVVYYTISQFEDHVKQH
jgi:hypothetical protein